MRNKYFIGGIIVVTLFLTAAFFFLTHKKWNSTSTSQAGPENNRVIHKLPALVLTSRQNGTMSEYKFPCFGMVYAYLTFPEDWHGEQVIEGNWIRPDGLTQEQPELKINFDTAPSRKIFFYLNSYEPSSMQQVGNGLQGKEKNSFDGVWSFEAKMYGHVIVRSTFSVSCE